MSRRYIVSDLHLGHKNISKFRNWNDPITGERYSSDDQSEMLFEKLMQLRKRDTLFLLGDTAFTEEWNQRLTELPCANVIGILGNHCTENGLGMDVIKPAYKALHGLLRYKDTWLSHAPIHPQELRGKVNIHGHTHHFLMLEAIDRSIDRNYINVCADYTGFGPISFEYALSDEYYQECVKLHEVNKHLQRS